MVFLAQLTGLAALLLASLNVEADPQTYTVWVGYEDLALGLNIAKYTPDLLQIHVGDTVVFQQKTHDPHTVTFYQPPHALPDIFVNGFEANPRAIFPVPNPLPQPYNGSYYAGSGLMTLAPVPGASTSWSVTFSRIGEFKFACSVHGLMQNGTIAVVADATDVPSPKEVKAAVNKWKSMVDKNKLKYYKNGLKSVTPTLDNGDGTKTYYVKVGWFEQGFEYLAFFPKSVTVKPNDKVAWYGSSFHTITFLNGQDVPGLIVPIGGKLLFNPVIYTPAGGSVITNTGLINAGLVVDPRQTITMTVDSSLHPGTKLPYMCLVHASSKMEGVVKIANKKKHMG